MKQITTMEAISLIMDELVSAEKKHPLFPTDPIHAVAIMYEERGEAMKAALQLVYEGGDMQHLRDEIAHWGAMAIRCLINIHNFKPVESGQK